MPAISSDWVLNQLAGMSFPERGEAYDFMKKCIDASSSLPEEPVKECKGKAAARALAVMVLDPKINLFLATNDVKALDQAKKSLEPFGYPDIEALRSKLGL